MSDYDFTKPLMWAVLILVWLGVAAGICVGYWVWG
jgi:hypothetical protein